jgi:HAD superfamily hydrolase (TIGR01549 family)
MEIGGVMSKAILFDLDDTLLDNNLEIFVPPLAQAMVQYFGAYVPAETARSALWNGYDAMDANAGTTRSNKEVFVEVFCSATGMQPDELDRHWEEFYAREFPKLAVLTHRLPEARPLVAWAIQKAYQVVIATGMQTPRIAVEQRLARAGVPVTDFAYAFITTWDNLHASKPHPAYYQEIVAKVQRQPAECLMVGDGWEHDIVPATSVGIPSYWIETGRTVPTSNALLVGQGTLAELFAWLREVA